MFHVETCQTYTHTKLITVLKTLGSLERSYGTIFTFEELLKITSVYQRGTWLKKEVPDRNISEVFRPSRFLTSRSIQLIVDAFFEDGIFERKFLFTFRPNQEQLRKMQL